MDTGSLGTVATAILFGIFGLVISYRRNRTAGIGSFIFFAAIAVIGSVMGVGTRLLDVFGFLVPLNWAIVAFCSGWILGSLLRNDRLGRLEKV